MQIDRSLKSGERLVKSSVIAEVVFAEISGRLLSFVQSFDDELRPISAAKELAADHDIQTLQVQAAYVESFKVELNRQNVKRRNQPEGWNSLRRMADFAALAKQPQSERDFLEKSFAIRSDASTAVRLAEVEQRDGRLEAALSLLDRSEQQADTDLILRRAYIFLSQDRVDEAESLIQRCLDVDPAKYASNLFSGALSLYRDNYAGAIRAFRAALDEQPASSVAHANLGIAYLNSGSPLRAFSSLRKAIHLNPLSAKNCGIYADLALSLKNEQEALRPLRYITTAFPSNVEMLEKYVRISLRLGDLDEARSALKRQIAVDDWAGTWNNLAVLEQRARNTELAFASYKKALDASSQTKPIGEVRRAKFLATRNLMNLFANENNSRKVIELYGDLGGADADARTLLDESLIDIHMQAIASMTILGMDAEVDVHCARLRARTPISPELAAWVMSIVLLRASTSRPISPDLHDLVKSAELLGEQAAAARSRIVIPLYNNMAFALVTANDFFGAQAALQRVAYSIHHDAYTTATLALLHYRRGDFARGKALYEEAIGLTTKPLDRLKIRQKLVLEMARAELQTSSQKSARILARLKASEVDTTLAAEYRELLSESKLSSKVN